MFRVNIHTADGWKEYGRYETMRGAQRAAQNAARKIDYLPLCHRVGGTDSTYLVVDDVPADGSPGYFELRFQKAPHLPGGVIEFNGPGRVVLDVETGEFSREYDTDHPDGPDHDLGGEGSSHPESHRSWSLAK